jgi:hypothetical protein
MYDIEFPSLPVGEIGTKEVCRSRTWDNATLYVLAPLSRFQLS